MKVKHLFFSIVGIAFLSSAMSIDHTLSVGKTAPQIETVSGNDILSEESLSGNSKLISFWSPKNPSSRINNRNLSLKYNSTDNENVDFISICIDSDEDLMREVMKIDGIDEANSYAISDIRPEVFKRYDVVDNPKAFLISDDGKILEII